jgi:Mrp family chromosome partitioning ATPase
VALGGLVGAAIGGLLAWPLAARRRPVDAASASAILGAPLLGAVPASRQLRRASGFLDFAQDTRLGNELKVVASSMVLSAHRRNLQAVVISSAHRREGKTVLARNLAAAAEYVGHPVVLVDAGFGRPTTTELLGLDQCPGIAEVVEGAPVSEVMHYFPYDDVGCLPVISLGLEGFTTEPGRRLNEVRREHWAKALINLRPMTPLVDTPAINDHPLALQLAAGGGLVVVVSPRTTLADLEVVRNRADAADVPILGLIIDESWPRAGKYPRKPIARGAHPEPNVVLEAELRDDIDIPSEVPASGPQ